jgi:hypothetical protein
MTELFDSPLLKKEIDLEKWAIADAVVKVNKIVDSEFMKQIYPKPDIQLLLKKFLNFL